MHARAEERSLALHRVVAERMRSDPRILDRARARVNAWVDHGGTHPAYVRAWQDVLSRSPAEVAAFLVDESEHARALRQATPFAGALDPRERWAILRGTAR